MISFTTSIRLSKNKKSIKRIIHSKEWREAKLLLEAEIFNKKIKPMSGDVTVFIRIGKARANADVHNFSELYLDAMQAKNTPTGFFFDDKQAKAVHIWQDNNETDTLITVRSYQYGDNALIEKMI